MSKTIEYSGPAYLESGECIDLDGTYEIEDTQLPEPDVGIFQGYVLIAHPDHDCPVEIPGDEIDAYYADIGGGREGRGAGRGPHVRRT